MRNNPAATSQHNGCKAQVMGACGGGTPGDPTLRAGVFPKAMQHAGGKQIATFTIMQMFPWFGTPRAGRENMEFKAESAYQKFRADGMALACDVQKQWHAILATQEKIKAAEGEMALPQDIRKLSPPTCATQDRTKGPRPGARPRMGAEGEGPKEQAESLGDQLRLQKEQLNIVMHRDAGSPLVIPDSIALREMPAYSLDDTKARRPAAAKSRGRRQGV